MFKTHTHTHAVMMMMMMKSVPSGGLPPHVSLSVTVHGLVQLLVALSDGVQISQIPHTQREAQQTHGHHRFILQDREEALLHTLISDVL